MNKPVLSIDVSKLNSHATAFLGYGKPFKKPFKFNHTPDDLNALLKWLDELEKLTNCKPQVVLEATGNFSKPIKQFFIDPFDLSGIVPSNNLDLSVFYGSDRCLSSAF